MLRGRRVKKLVLTGCATVSGKAIFKKRMGTNGARDA